MSRIYKELLQTNKEKKIQEKYKQNIWTRTSLEDKLCVNMFCLIINPKMHI